MKNRAKWIIRSLIPRILFPIFYKIKYRDQQLADAVVYQNALRGKSGIEIGGPSIAFSTFLPIYPVVKSLDGVNFSERTTWEGRINTERPYRFHKNKVGRQFIAEASELFEIPSERYDFLVSSNCLEHIANPIRALKEWVRVVVPSGFLLIVLPNKSSNFDHRRPVTSFEHLLSDYARSTSEHDLTHLKEILELHDIFKDSVGSLESLKRRCQKNFENRCIHHHVFDVDLLVELCLHLKLSVIQTDTNKTDHFILVQKIDLENEIL